MPVSIADALHQACYMNPTPKGLTFGTDTYAMRTLLRKAHRFTFDAQASDLIGRASALIADGLDAARKKAIPPFPTTFLQVDNEARLLATKDMGVSLTSDAEFNPVPTVGWLIEQDRHQPTAYRATYVTLSVGEDPKTVFILPFGFAWDTSEKLMRCPWHHVEPEFVTAMKTSYRPEDYLFGIVEAEVYNVWATETWSDPRSYQQRFIRGMAREMTGELRHIFAALNLFHAVAVETTAPPTGRKLQVSGKVLDELTYSEIKFTLGKRKLSKIIEKHVTGIRKRKHDVRAHFRTYRNEDGSVKRVTPIPAHERGDKNLGQVLHVYNVVGPKK